jgi:hypothetical protein
MRCLSGGATAIAISPHVVTSQFCSPSQLRSFLVNCRANLSIHCESICVLHTLTRMDTTKMFSDPRRIVTGHSEAGRAIITSDKAIPCVPTPINCNFAVLWETFTFPSDNTDERDPAELKTESLANKDGVVLRVVDFPPKTETVGLDHIQHNGS